MTVVRTRAVIYHLSQVEVVTLEDRRVVVGRLRREFEPERACQGCGHLCRRHLPDRLEKPRFVAWLETLNVWSLCLGSVCTFWSGGLMVALLGSVT